MASDSLAHYECQYLIVLAELLVLWHEHRAGVLLSAAVAITVIRLVIHLRSTKATITNACQTSPARLEKDAKSAIESALPNQESERSQLRDSDHLVDVVAEKVTRPSLKLSLIHI